jgi:hypothetical protein
MPPPDPLDQNYLMQVKRWRGANKRYEKLVKQREENQKRAYAIVWGQCSPTVQDRVKASANFQMSTCTQEKCFGKNKTMRLFSGFQDCILNYSCRLHFTLTFEFKSFIGKHILILVDLANRRWWVVFAGALFTPSAERLTTELI